MHQIYPDQGLIFQLLEIADGAGDGLYWRLFENNITPSLDDVLADYTLSDDSWGRINVVASAFTLQQVFTHIATIQGSNLVFTNTTGSTVTIYGYVITDFGESIVLGAARFDAAPLTVLDGGTVVVTPILGALSDLSS